MKKQEIEKVKEVIEEELAQMVNSTNSSAEEIRFFEILNILLENKLERLENKPLSLEELKGMIGEPVWVECEEPHWIIIKKIHLTENCLNVLATNNMWYSDIEIKFDIICQFEGVDNCTFYKHKPKENDD